MPPQPDVAVVRPYTCPSRSYPSDVYFVIEVADSSLPYDSGPKLARYAAAGIPEVWIANLRIREVTVYTDPSGSEYATASTYRAGDSVSPHAFPDVALAVDEFMPPASAGPRRSNIRLTVSAPNHRITGDSHSVPGEPPCPYPPPTPR